MRQIACLFFVLSSIGAYAQIAADQTLAKDGKTLGQRYAWMKEKSQTFNDYKVIKEYILDGFWKLSMDSLQQVSRKLDQATFEASQLQIKLNEALAAIQQKEESMQEVVFAGTHIKVLGIDFSKHFFLSSIGILLLGLVLFFVVIAGRLRLIQSLLKEKEEQEDRIGREFEAYKRKSLEKQMKLSRELQDERNRVAEMRMA